MNDKLPPMHALAERYAKELEVQLGTLGLFTKHPGEVGRVHEHFLRGVLRRLLPPSLRLGTGFISHGEWTSKQCDILVTGGDLPELFSAGDVVVADLEAVSGVVEVKTDLSSEHFAKSLKALSEIEVERQRRRRGRFTVPDEIFRVIYAYKGVEPATLEKHLQAWVCAVEEAEGAAQAPVNLGSPGIHGNPYGYMRLPDVVLVRSQYVLMRDHNTLVGFDLENDRDDGKALLLLAARIWRQLRSEFSQPWWLRNLLQAFDQAEHQHVLRLKANEA